MPLPRTQATPKDIEKQWFVVDAADVVLGRLASPSPCASAASTSRPIPPTWIAVTTSSSSAAEKVRLTGNKRSQKATGYRLPGARCAPGDKILDGRFPTRVIEKAVERMIPRGPLGRNAMRNLHVYAGPDHPHQAQQPTALDIAGMNAKNKR